MKSSKNNPDLQSTSPPSALLGLSARVQTMSFGVQDAPVQSRPKKGRSAEEEEIWFVVERREKWFKAVGQKEMPATSFLMGMG